MSIRPKKELENDETPRNSPYRKFVKYLSLIMGIIYLAFGGFILVNDLPNISETFKYILGGILILYGFMRLLRAYQQFFRSPNRRDR